MIANPNQPVALSIAGSDSCGGAGIQADLKTFAAFGVHGATALTAITAQNTNGVSAVEIVAPDLIARQIEAVAQGAKISAVKTGMLGDGPTIIAVARELEKLPPHTLIVDPVMVATSGARLQSDEAVLSLKTKLLPTSNLITPNLDEAAVLLEAERAHSSAEMEEQVIRLSEMFQTAVLLKGGHLNVSEDAPSVALDVLASNGTLTWFDAPFVVDADMHGTGCTLSAAITAALALGRDLETAIREAKSYVTKLLCASRVSQ